MNLCGLILLIFWSTFRRSNLSQMEMLNDRRCCHRQAATTEQHANKFQDYRSTTDDSQGSKAWASVQNLDPDLKLFEAKKFLYFSFAISTHRTAFFMISGLLLIHWKLFSMNDSSAMEILQRMDCIRDCWVLFNKKVFIQFEGWTMLTELWPLDERQCWPDIHFHEHSIDIAMNHSGNFTFSEKSFQREPFHSLHSLHFSFRSNPVYPLTILWTYELISVHFCNIFCFLIHSNLQCH